MNGWFMHSKLIVVLNLTTNLKNSPLNMQTIFVHNFFHHKTGILNLDKKAILKIKIIFFFFLFCEYNAYTKAGLGRGGLECPLIYYAYRHELLQPRVEVSQHENYCNKEK